MTGKIMFLEKLNWRYATKKMDTSKAVPEEAVAKIVEAIQMAPTSSGLQPYELLVIRNADVRAAIRPVAWDQAQITDGSHLLVFAAWDTYSEERIDAVVDQMAEERGGRSEMLQGYYDRLKAMYLPRTDEENYAHAARQAYIGLGFALAAAAELEVDSTPMEGFDPAKVDEILGLKAKGLRSVVLLPLGYRDESGDWLVNLKKVRKPLGTFVTNID
jgi:nitroreductase